MKLIRWAGENVTPSDDAKLSRRLYADGLFASVTPTYTSGTITIPALYGIMCGRDFTTDEETLDAVLATSGTITGQIYMYIDTEDATYPLDLKIRNSVSSLPTNDINADGTTYGIEIAQYTANTSEVTGVTFTANIISSVLAALALKAPLASPTFTGTPIAPTAATGTNTTQLATTAFVGGATATKMDDYRYILIDISTIDTFESLATLMLANKNKVGKCQIGESDGSSNFRTLVGNPAGFAQYTEVLATTSYGRSSLLPIIELSAIGLLIGKSAKAYVFYDDVGWKWTGWAVLV